MGIWPFKRKQVEPTSAEEIRDTLIEAAAKGSQNSLRRLCNQYKNQVAENVELMCKAPKGMPTDSASVDRYIQCLGAVAECLAKDCDAPELWNQLCGTPESNPILRWEQWLNDLPGRVANLEYDALIAECGELIEQTRALKGTGAQKNEAILLGRLGELLFHSGRVSDSIAPFKAALKVCNELADTEGQLIYLRNLLEAYRYLGNTSDALEMGEELVRLSDTHGQDSSELQSQLDRMRKGEPLCRIVCVRDGKEMELTELANLSEGRYQFQFHRNRLSLQKATALVQQANNLASSGQLADALEKYQSAMEVDPYDPQPVYQSGMCLLELGAYGKAREAFEEVERLAPGWFHNRSCRWLAEALETEKISDEEFRLLRILEDSELSNEEALAFAKQAITNYPTFAPLYLILGDLHRNRQENDEAKDYYRKGLELVLESDLESRLLCALAGILPQDSSERIELVRRALALKGNLVAQATAKLIGVQ